MTHSLLKKLDELAPAQLESLTFDLLQLLGLRNCVWRTPGRDGGRDIQGDSIESDFSGYTRTESWYVDCKRYASSVSWPIVWEKLAYAESNSADVLLIVTNSTLSPQAVDEVNRWNTSRKSPSVRFWNGTELEKRLRIFPEILVKYSLTNNPVADAANSLLPLTKVLMKYSNSAAAAAAFETSADGYYEVTHAVSELISARLEEVENHGHPRTAPFRLDDDSYAWLPRAVAAPLLDLDRYVIRALLALLRCHGAIPTRTVRMDAGIQLILNGMYRGSLKDLETVSYWGDIRVALSEGRSELEIYYD